MRRIVVLHRAVLLPAVFLLVSALLLSIQIVDPESSHAAGLPRLTGEGVTIYYDAGLQSTARSVKGAYPELKADVEKKIGWKMKSKPAIYLIDRQGSFEEMGGDESTAAFTLMPKARIVVDMASFNGFLLLNQTLRHELCHVLLHDHIRGDLPDWLEEGICEWVGGTPVKPASQVRRVMDAYGLYRSGVPLSRLHDFSKSRTGMGMAYGQSEAFIEYVVSRYGAEGISRVLDRLRQGDSVRKAFMNGLSQPPETLEGEWREDLARRAKWAHSC